MPITSLRQYSTWFILAYDLFGVGLVWFLSFFLQFAANIPAHVLAEAITAFPIVFLIQAMTYRYFRTYRSVWRFTSFSDLRRIVKSVALGWVAILAVFYYSGSGFNLSLGALLRYPLMLIAYLSAGRALARYLFDLQKNKQHDDVKKIIIVGAGHGAEMFLRELSRLPVKKFNPVALVDDNARLLGKEIHGVRVEGKLSVIAAVAKKLHAEQIVVAIPSIKGNQLRRIVSYCEEAKLPVSVLPSVEELATGQVAISELRNVSIEDLLGRAQVQLDWSGISHFLTNKTVLVTGGGGSIGAELCRQILKLSQPSKLIIVDHSEYNLYEIALELEKSKVSCHFHLVSVTNKVDMEAIFAHYKPHVVFHAAAYKHVPLLEHQPHQAIVNNVLGTINVAELANKYSAEKFVLISTDKAVNPTNIMGATKRAAEIFCQNFSQYSQTAFVTVRFGNVLGSAGSVLPLFKKQLAAGGPITVTHPDITRYFMTIPEACQLLLQAGELGKGGEILVLDMGEPIKITYLAEKLIRLSGKVPNEDISIIYTGLRPGEKLYEELFHEKEDLVATSQKGILRAGSRYWNWDILKKTVQEITEKTKQAENEKELIGLLKFMVPEATFSVQGPVKTKVVKTEN